MKSSLYLETTIPGYLTSRPSRDLIVAGHRQVTREWWETQRDTFQLYISQLVMDEVSAGDPAAAGERLKMLKDLPLLDITPEVTAAGLPHPVLGQNSSQGCCGCRAYLNFGVHGIDFLMTWNCVHLANAAHARALAAICREHAYECPVICTPEELMGE